MSFSAFVTVAPYDCNEAAKGGADIVCTGEHDELTLQNDGSGSGFRTRNSCHKLACSTEERLSYYPTYCQQIYDTDLKKSLICIDPANKIWVDAMGNEV